MKHIVSYADLWKKYTTKDIDMEHDCVDAAEANPVTFEEVSEAAAVRTLVQEFMSEFLARLSIAQFDPVVMASHESTLHFNDEKKLPTWSFLYNHDKKWGTHKFMLCFDLTCSFPSMKAWAFG